MKNFTLAMFFICSGILNSKVSFSQCQATKVLICHNGNTTLHISTFDAKAHIAHGDKYGSCTGVRECTLVATGGKITCSKKTVTLTAKASIGGTFTWTGPNGFTSNLTNPVVSVSGIYKVKGSNCPNITDTALVSLDSGIPNVKATGGIVSCASPSVSLNATSSTSGVSFKWTGPNNFTSTVARPIVTTPGSYIVTTTKTSNGCMATATAVVQQNNTAPLNITVTGGTLTCTNSSVRLTAASSVSSVTYRWSGPNGFNSTLATPTVNVPGKYTITATRSSSGCTATTSVVVNQSGGPGVTATGGSISCTNPTVTLTAISPTSGVTFRWNGPNSFTSISATPVVSTGGTYTVLVTNRNNGCTSTATAVVAQNVGLSLTATGGTINCIDSSVKLMAVSSATGLTYAWSGPNSFTSSLARPIVHATGTYKVTVINPANGCTAMATASVNRNISPPTVTASGGAEITCAHPSVVLNASSSTSGVIFRWSGPGNFNSSSPTPRISAGGTYTVTATNPVNGCKSAVGSVAVSQNASVPGVTATGGSITCVHPAVTLNAASSATSVRFAWTGPNGFASTLMSPAATAPGTYEVTVTDTLNGCRSTNAAVIQQNITEPAIVTVQASGTITCSMPSVVLTGTSITTNVIYSWIGPNGFVSDSVMPSVALPGVYYLELTDTTNGCTSNDSVIVSHNIIQPTGIVTNPSVTGTLTCTDSTLVLTGGSATTGVSYSWTGPDGFTSDQRITTIYAQGIYILKVTDTTNGCGSTASVNVVQNISTPVAVTASNSEPLTCFTGLVSLSGSSQSPSVSYAWAGPNGFTSSSPTTSVGIAGTYTLTVTDLLNGCISTAATTVEENMTPPENVTAVNSGPLTCFNGTATLTGSSSTPGVRYSWFGPNGFFAETRIATTHVQGEYMVMAVDVNNGCSSIETTIVEEDLTDCRGMTQAQGTQTSDPKLKFNAYPNPASDKAFISFQSLENTTVTVSIYNDNGAYRKMIFNRKVEASCLYTLELAAYNLSSGIYYCMITANNKTYMKKLVILK